MSKGEVQDPPVIQIQPARIKPREAVHTVSAMDNFPVGRRIAKQIGNVVRWFADERFRIDRKPTSATAIKYIAMMQITMKREGIALGGE